jgi:hypothetical protein
MKQTCLLTFLVIALIASCSRDNIPVISQSEDALGLVTLSVQVGPKGGVKRYKRSQTDSLESSNLILEVKSDPPTISYADTIKIVEGVNDTFKIYQLPVELDWFVTAWIVGEDGLVTHNAESSPINLTQDGKDTVSLYLTSIISHFKLGFQAPNGGKRAVLCVDSIPRDTVYMETMGEFVQLFYPRMEASLEGVDHLIQLYVSGDLLGFTDTLLYYGDTTITARSGEEFQAPLALKYIGPGSDKTSDLNFEVQVGIIGEIVFNAKLEKPRIDYLEHQEGTKFILGGKRGIALKSSVLEDGFVKLLDDIKFECSEKKLYETCDKAFLVHFSDTLSRVDITEATGEFLSFRNVNVPFRDSYELDLVLSVREDVSRIETRFRCVRINGRTNSGIRIAGYFQGDSWSPWSEICYLGN